MKSLLPNELLARIVFLTLRGSHAKQFSQLHQLAQVSVAWFQLVKATPSLFGDVTTDRTFEDALRALHLSKDASLHVKYYPDRQAAHPWRDELLETLLSQVHQWRSIHLRLEI